MSQNEIIAPVEEEMVTVPKKLLKDATIVVRPEKVEEKPKEKKPRTEKQLAATARMRDALAKRREGGKQEYGATKHTEAYKESIQKAEEKAEKIKEEVGVNVVVKKPAGRPKGSKIVKEAPTPHYQSEEEEEYIPPKKEKRVNVIHVQNQAQRPMSYLERLNAHLI
jgi:hypothetical protein